MIMIIIIITIINEFFLMRYDDENLEKQKKIFVCIKKKFFSPLRPPKSFAQFKFFNYKKERERERENFIFLKYEKRKKNVTVEADKIK